jgi:ketopantoate reductase
MAVSRAARYRVAIIGPGALLRLARRHRIAAPTHAAFYRLIQLAAPR